MNLPPLPELPVRNVTRESVTGAVLWETEEGPYSAEEVRELLLSYGRAVQEACAEACESLNPKPATMSGILERASIAAAIRKG